MINRFKLVLYLMVICSFSNGQLFISADPFNLFKYEQEKFLYNQHQQSLLLRPLINQSNNSRWSIVGRNEFFINDNGPNLENMGNRYIGKGAGMFTGIHLSYSGKFLSLNIEPFFLINHNKEVLIVEKPGIFTVLNDNRYFTDQPYVSYGFRESQLFFHYKEIGFGISNTNMWWGPGIHTSLTMTNNTSGFPHLMIGTINEKRFKNIGINIRYIFTQLEKMLENPYYTAFVFSGTIYSKPTISFGLGTQEFFISS